MEALNPVPPGREHWVVSPEVHAAEWVAGYRGSTRENYARIIRAWLWFCGDSHLDPWSIDRRHIEAWLATMKSHTARQAATVVCGFYRDAHSKGITKNDLAWGVRRPMVGRGPAGSWATPEELARMLTIARADGGDTWGLMAILILTGARVGETCALTIKHVESRDPLRLRFERKMAHIDILTMPPGVVEALTPLIEKRSTGALLRWEGHPMNPQVARRIVTSIGERAECEQHITPHSLRRSFVTLARDAGVPDVEIMAMTGHSDPTMIDYYDRGRRQRSAAAGLAVEAVINDHSDN